MERNNILVLEKHKNDTAGCRLCIRKSSCLGHDLSASVGQGADGQALQQKLVHQGQQVFRAGDTCDGIYLVRSGAFKSYFVDAEGELQVLGFYLPGELLGVEGLVNGTYGHCVEALGTGSICKIPLSRFPVGQGRADSVQPLMSLLSMVGQAMSRSHKLIFVLSKMNAERRFAYFLLDFVDRLRVFGVEQSEFTLSMTRADIANYLGLAVETISRLFTRMQERGLLEINRRRLKIYDMQALRALVDDQPTKAMLLDKAS